MTKLYLPFTDNIKKFCELNNITITKFTDYQTRFSTNNIAIDIYWVSGRFHIIKHPDKEFVAMRGEVGNIEAFFESIFLV